MKKNTRIDIRVNEEIKNEIKNVAAYGNMSVSELIMFMFKTPDCYQLLLKRYLSRIIINEPSHVITKEIDNLPY